MRDTSWAMLAFALIGAALGWQYLRDRRRGRDALGLRGSPALLVGMLSLLGVFGAGVWAGAEASLEGAAFWACLTTGAEAIGFSTVLGAAYVREALL